MPIIKAISDLRNKSQELSELAHGTDEAILIQGILHLARNYHEIL